MHPASLIQALFGKIRQSLGSRPFRARTILDPRSACAIPIVVGVYLLFTPDRAATSRPKVCALSVPPLFLLFLLLFTPGFSFSLRSLRLCVECFFLPLTPHQIRPGYTPGYTPATPPATPRLRTGYARLDGPSIPIPAPISPPKSLLFICPVVLHALSLPNTPRGVFHQGVAI